METKFVKLTDLKSEKTLVVNFAYVVQMKPAKSKTTLTFHDGSKVEVKELLEDLQEILDLRATKTGVFNDYVN